MACVARATVVVVLVLVVVVVLLVVVVVVEDTPNCPDTQPGLGTFVFGSWWPSQHLLVSPLHVQVLQVAALWHALQHFSGPGTLSK
mmetsp:Transcript_25731/g.72699  ORF Transcript_25731/g.72699 Transcript_25731/m.72699 type:complete len:86 (+) Transcript_25731:167-424(+)